MLLEVSHPDIDDRLITLTPGSMVLGARLDADIVLLDPDIQSEHLRIELDEQSAVSVTPVEGADVTLQRNRRGKQLSNVLGPDAHSLSPGDRFVIGQTILTFHNNEAVPERRFRFGRRLPKMLMILTATLSCFGAIGIAGYAVTDISVLSEKTAMTATIKPVQGPHPTLPQPSGTLTPEIDRKVERMEVEIQDAVAITLEHMESKARIRSIEAGTLTLEMPEDAPPAPEDLRDVLLRDVIGLKEVVFATTKSTSLQAGERRISGLWLGRYPYVVMSDATIVRPGEEIETGVRLVEVHQGHIIVEIARQKKRISF